MQKREQAPDAKSVAALMRSEPSPAEAYLIEQHSWSRPSPWDRPKQH
jgi:hypothetical protein